MKEKLSKGNGLDPVTGRFLPGNVGGGRRKLDWDFQALMDERIPREKWADMLDAQVTKALSGDTAAFKILVERRFGEPIKPGEQEASDRFFAFLAAVRSGNQA